MAWSCPSADHDSDGSGGGTSSGVPWPAVYGVPSTTVDAAVDAEAHALEGGRSATEGVMLCMHGRTHTPRAIMETALTSFPSI